MKNKNFLGRLSATALLGASALVFAGSADAACQPEAAQYNLPAQRLDTSLQDFGHVSGCPVHVNTQLLGDKKANALHGRYPPAVALVRLVRGSGLEVHVDDGHYAVNHDDEQAMQQRIEALTQRLDSASKQGTLDKATADKLKSELSSAGTESKQLIREQGFLSAAEKASYQRLFVYVEGWLNGKTEKNPSS